MSDKIVELHEMIILSAHLPATPCIIRTSEFKMRRSRSVEAEQLAHLEDANRFPYRIGFPLRAGNLPKFLMDSRLILLFAFLCYRPPAILTAKSRRQLTCS